MYQDNFARIHEGMDVYDHDGDKIGSVGEVFASTGVGKRAPGGTSASSPTTMDGWVKVDTGILGLGKDLYIPDTAISRVESDRVFLNVDKDEIDNLGWDQRPSSFPH